jgi:subtilisin-like proprotein convertase family protein
MIPELAALKGKVPAGSWSLEVRDHARQDVGKLRSFALEMMV